MRKSPVHYIAPSAISVTTNANASSRDLAVYIARGAKFKVYSSGIPDLGFTDEGTFQEWAFSGRNRRLASSTDPYTVYARLRKATAVSEETVKDPRADGYLVFAKKQLEEDKWKDKYPYVTMEGLCTDTATPTEEITKATETYWYVKLGSVSAPGENGQRTLDIDTGILGTEQWNTEWRLEPDDLPLRIDFGCTIDGKDAGLPPYLYWNQTAVLRAHLVQGFETNANGRVDHWTISRNLGKREGTDVSPDNGSEQSENAEWPETERAAAFGSTGIINIMHSIAGTDDFLSAVSAVFTVTAWGVAAADSSNAQEDTTYVRLATASVTMLAEAVASYDLELSDHIVTFNPQTGLYSPAAGVVVRIRAKAQDGSVFYPTAEHIASAQLHVYYLPVDEDSVADNDSEEEEVAGPPELELADGTYLLPITAFAAGKSINLWLENGAQIVLARDTVGYVSSGANGDTPINCYRWYKEGETVNKPSDTTADEPDATNDSCQNDSRRALPVMKWSKTAPNRPADGWELWMCQSVKHTGLDGRVTRDAWSDPVRISGANGTAGEDVKEREWIYRRTTTSTAPDTPIALEITPVYRGDVYAIVNSSLDTPSTDYGDAVLVRNSATVCEWTKGENGGEDTLQPMRTATIGDYYEHVEDGIFYCWNGKEWVDCGNTRPASFSNIDDYVPTGWTDNPQGVSKEMPFEWASWRSYDKRTGTWGPFQTPILWSHYGHNGMDGDGVEYVFIRTITEDAPAIADSQGTDSNGHGYTDDEYLPSAYVEADNAGIEANNINPSQHPSKYNGYDCGECTDEPTGPDPVHKYEWVAMRTKSAPNSNGQRTWNRYSGTMALWANYSENSVRLDIDNEMDMVQTNSLRKILAARTVQTVVHLYDGTEEVDISTASVNPASGTGINVSGGPATSGQDAVASFSSGASGKGKRLAWAFIAGKTMPQVYNINIAYTYKGDARTATFAVAASMGIPVYQMKPSQSAIVYSRQADNTLVSLNNTLSLVILKVDGNDTTELTPAESGMTIRYSMSDMPASASGGDAWPSGNSMTVDSSVANVYIAMFNANGTLIDRETVPVMKDGANGSGHNTVIVDLDNQHEDFIYNDDDDCVSGPVVTQARLYDGRQEMTEHAAWSISANDDNTWGASAGSNIGDTATATITSTGRLTVSGLLDKHATVRVRAKYPNGDNGNYYYAVFNANKRKNEKYELQLKPGSLVYNPDTYHNSKNIAISARRTDLLENKTAVTFGEYVNPTRISTTSNKGTLRLFYSWVTDNDIIGMNQHVSASFPVSRLNAEAYDGIYFELRKYDNNDDDNSSTDYTVEDYESVAIVKSGMGAKGDNAVRIDLDNQADIVAVYSTGKVRFNRDVTLQARIYDGAAPATTGVSLPNDMTAGQYAGSLAVGGATPTVTLESGVLTVIWHFTPSNTMTQGAYNISIELVYGGNIYTAVFTLVAMDGNVIWQLKPSTREVAFARNADNSFVLPYIDLSVGWLKTDADSTTAHDYTEIDRSQPDYIPDSGGLFIIARAIDASGSPVATYTLSDPTQPEGWDWVTGGNAIGDCQKLGNDTYNKYGALRIANNTAMSAIEFAISKVRGQLTTEADIIDRETIHIVKGAVNGSIGVGYSSMEEYYAVSAGQNARPLRWTADDGGTRTFDNEAAFTTALGNNTQWHTGSASTNAETPWLWNFEKHLMTDGTVRVTTVHRIGNFAKGIRSIQEFYALSEYEDQTRAIASIYNPKNWLVDYYDGMEYDEPQRMWASKYNPSWWYGPSMLAVTIDNYLDEWDEPKYGYMGGDMSDGFNSLSGRGDTSAPPTYYRATGNINRAPTTALPYQWNWEHIVYTDGTKEDFFHISARIGDAGPAGPAGNTPVSLYRWVAEGANVSAPTVTGPNYVAGNSLEGWSKTAPNRPETGVNNLYMSQNTLRANNTLTAAWSNPVCISGAQGTPGEDAKEREWVYRRSTSADTPEAPAVPSGNFRYAGDVYDIFPPTGATISADDGDTVLISNSAYIYVWTDEDGLVEIGTAAVGDYYEWLGPDEYYYWNGSAWANAGTTAPAGPISAYDDFVPSGWTDRPKGVTAATPYEYASFRTYDNVSKTWSTFSTPILWSHYGHNGVDGDGVEYVFFRTKGENYRPTVSTTGDAASAIAGSEYEPKQTQTGANYDTSYNSNRWSDDPRGTSSEWPIEWVSQRRKIGNTWGTFSTPATWAKWSEDGVSQPRYIQTQEAWSNDASTASATTMPADCEESSWQDSTPANTSNRAYLWRRSRTMTLDGNTRTYISSETWTYARLSGTNGTSIAVKGSVQTVAELSNISSPQDGDAYVCTANGHLYMWSEEAGQWLDIGQFKGDSGTTYYTHVAWAKGITIGQQSARKEGQTNTPNASGIAMEGVSPCFTISPRDGYEWMGVLIDTDATDSTDWKYYTWKYTKGGDGTSPWMADLDNEMDSVLCDINGRVTGLQQVQTTVRLWHGSDKENFSLAVYDTDASQAEYNNETQQTTTNTVRTSWTDGDSVNENTLTVTFDNDAQFSLSDGYKKVFCLVLTAKSDSSIRQTLYLTVNAARPGANGEPARRVNLVPNPSQINVGRTSAGTFTPQNVGLTCGYTVQTGSGEPTAYNDGKGMIENGYYIYFRRRHRADGNTYANPTWENDGGRNVYHKYAARNTYLTALDVGTYDAVEFIVCKNTEEQIYSPTSVIDRETVPVLADGKEGAGSVRLDLDNENEVLLYDDNGVTNYSGTVTSKAYLYDGANDVTNQVRGWSIADYDGVQTGDSENDNYASVDHTGLITVTGISKQSGYVKVEADYNGAHYYARFSLKRQLGGSTYKLKFTGPNAISYNATTGVASASQIAVSVQKLTAGGTYTPSAPPTGYSIIFGTPGTTGGYARIKAVSGASTATLTFGSDGCGPVASYSEVRVVIGKTIRQGDINIIDETSIHDSETVLINRVMDGEKGPSGPSAVINPNPILFDGDSDGLVTANSYKQIKVTMTAAGADCTITRIANFKVVRTTGNFVVSRTSSGESLGESSEVEGSAKQYTLYVHTTSEETQSGSVSMDVEGNNTYGSFKATATATVGVNKQGKPGQEGKDAAVVTFDPGILVFEGDANGNVTQNSEKTVAVGLSVNGSRCAVSKIESIAAPNGINVDVTSGSSTTSSTITVAPAAQAKTLYVRIVSATNATGSIGMKVTGTLGSGSSAKTYSAWGYLTLATTTKGTQGNSIKGDTGAVFAMRGKFVEGTEYTRNAEYVDMVFFDDGEEHEDRGRGNWYYLSSHYTTNKSGNTYYAPATTDADGNTYTVHPKQDTETEKLWIKADNYGVVITQGLFADFAKFGSAIISGDWMFSCNGEMDILTTPDNISTKQRTEVSSTDVHNPAKVDRSVQNSNGRITENIVGYRMFEPRFPMGTGRYDIEINTPIVQKSDNEAVSYKSVSEDFILRKGVTYLFRIKARVDNSYGDRVFACVYDKNGPPTYLYSLGNTGSTDYTEVSVMVTPGKTVVASVGMGVSRKAGSTGAAQASVSSIAYEVVSSFIPYYAVDLLTGKTYQRNAYIEGEVHATSGVFNGIVKASSFYTGSTTKNGDCTIDPANGDKQLFITGHGADYEQRITLPPVGQYEGMILRFFNAYLTRSSTSGVIVAQGADQIYVPGELYGDLTHEYQLPSNRVVSFVAINVPLKGPCWVLMQ